MSKIRRGNYVFITWKGDHGPRHVHVYRDGSFVVKWDLEHQQLMRGRINRTVRSLIEELISEGLL